MEAAARKEKTLYILNLTLIDCRDKSGNPFRNLKLDARQRAQNGKLQAQEP